jgi:class 3 adenylate cyclase
MIRTVLELDLAGYTDIAVALEEALDVQAVRTFEDQIQRFVDEGLSAVGLERDKVVLGTAGDNAILVFESADAMYRFAEAVQRACLRYNADKTTPLARRWFRMGAATGPVELDREKRRIIGTTIARAVRLEAASRRGAILVDRATFEALPEAPRGEFGPPCTVKGKRSEQLVAYRRQFIPEQEIGERARPAGHAVRRAILAALLTVAGLAAVWGLVVRRWASPATSAPIRGGADVHVFSPSSPERNDRPISYPGLLPLRPGDRVRLEVRLDRPAYVYLLWVAPTGRVIPVYPWRPGDWSSIGAPRPVATVVYPSEEPDGVPMKEGVEGREVFLALARATPLPAGFDLEGAITRCIPDLPVRNPRALVRFRDRGVEATDGQDRDPDFLLDDPREDPFRLMAERLRAELGGSFEFIDGVAFASQLPRE